MPHGIPQAITSFELIERLQAHYGGVSVYRVAKELGLDNGRVLHWARARTAPNQKESVRIARILNIDPGYVLASMEAQRQSEPELAEAWERLALRCA